LIELSLYVNKEEELTVKQNKFVSKLRQMKSSSHNRQRLNR